MNVCMVLDKLMMILFNLDVEGEDELTMQSCLDAIESTSMATDQHRILVQAGMFGEVTRNGSVEQPPSMFLVEM